jgi:hypothetical protein
MSMLRLLICACLLNLLPTVSFAVTERLDDSASPRSRVGSQSAWNQQGQLLTPTSTETAVILKFGRVNYKLATAKYVGKQARIYYVIPTSINGLKSAAALKIQWQGNGLFGGGFARPGERVLVWSGWVRDAWMSEAFDLTMHLDLRDVRLPPGQAFGFEAYFEIETSP